MTDFFFQANWSFNSPAVTALLIVVSGIFLWILIKYGLIRLCRQFVHQNIPRLKDVFERSQLFLFVFRLLIMGAIYFFMQYLPVAMDGWVAIFDKIIFTGLMITLFQVIRLIGRIILVEIQAQSNIHSLMLKTLYQVGQLVLFLVFIIVIISGLLNKSPLLILSSLGAFTAVLILIFKDAILGFVASVQVSILGIVKEGDWIEMPVYHADGTIIDIYITSIRVQNWDKTISTIPTYALVSEPFKNWRGMEEAKCRRIKRGLHIDVRTIRECDQSWIDARTKTLKFSVSNNNQTNIGLFRQYVLFYVRNHPSINTSATLLVRQLQSTQYGLPIELYCFTNTTDWGEYEDIQSDIFDHLMSVIPLFDLAVFQLPTTLDAQLNQ